MSANEIQVKDCWRVCGKCEGLGCTECFSGELPVCPCCGESPESYFWSSREADAWVDAVIAAGGHCPECLPSRQTFRAADAAEPISEFGNVTNWAEEVF